MSRLLQPSRLETFVVAVFVAGVVTGCEATRLPNPHSGPAKAAANGLQPQQPALPFVDLAAPKKIAREADQAIRRALQKKVSVKFVGVPLEKVLDKFAELGGINVWIDRGALEEEEIALGTPILLTVENQPLETALKWLLPPLDLAWFIEDGVLKITTETDAEYRLVTRMYDVSAFRDEGFDPAIIAEMLISHTSGLWTEIAEEEDGGTLVVLNDVLVIRQTHKLHREIPQLLQALMAAVTAEGVKSGTVPLVPANLADVAVFNALNRRLTVDHQKTPLNQVAADLSKRVGIPIRIDKLALEDELDITTDTLITAKYSNMILYSILKMILGDIELTAVIEDGSLVVTSETVAEEKLRTFIYNIRDLVSEGYTGDELAEAIVESTSGLWQDIDGGTIDRRVSGTLVILQTDRVHREIAMLLSDLWENISRRKTQSKRTTRSKQHPIETRIYSDFTAPIEDLVKAIPIFVAPGTWNSKGKPTGQAEQGKPGAIRKVGTTLVIRHTTVVHRKIQQFLQTVEQQSEGKRIGENPPGFFMGPFGAGGGFFSRQP